MGFLKSLGSLFGLSGSKTASRQYGGYKPYLSLKEIPETKLYTKTLTDRIAGRGVGFGPEFLSRTTSPYATARRAGVKEYEIPQITQAASARGMGRSSLVASQIGQAEKEASRDIEQRIADMYLREQLQKRREINQALADLFPYITAEAGTRAGRAGFDYRDWARAQKGRIAEEKARAQGAGRLAGLAAKIAATAIGGATGGPIGAMAGGQIGSSIFGEGGTSSMSMSDLFALQNMMGGSNTGGTVRKVKPVNYSYGYTPSKGNVSYLLK